MEQEPAISPEAKPEPYDKEWFDELQRVGGDSGIYSSLDPIDKGVHRSQEREKFETGKIENPVLDYPKLKQEELQQRESRLVDLKKKIIDKDCLGDEKMELVQQVWRWKMNEKIAGVRMLEAAASGDMKRFQAYSEFIYGAPSPEIFAFSIHFLFSEIEKYESSENIHLRKAAEDLKKSLPENSSVLDVRQLPNDETFTFAKNQTFQELGHLINLPEDQEEFSAGEIQKVLESALVQARLDGWKVVIDPNRSDMMVSGAKKEVSIPAERNSSRQRLTELIVHEIGTHAIRRQNGERSRLLLLGSGLDRYQDDEGVTGLREQVVRESIDDFTHLDRHLAISLARGLDGVPRDFREVYTVMQKYYLFNELSKGEPEDIALKKSKDEAWKRCIRTFRGTDCKTKGACFTKDIIYREANMDVWDVVRKNPQEMMRFNIGKYDPANPRHIMILERLGITDEDLNALE